MANISNNQDTNRAIDGLDDHRRRLGIASLHGKIKACIHLLKFADEACGDAKDVYIDVAKTDAHVYACVEAISTALSEVKDHSSVGMELCRQIAGDRNVPVLTNFATQMRTDNGIA